MGQLFLQNIFQGPYKVDNAEKELYFPFPETWLNIIEQRDLIKRLFHYYPNSSFTIQTQSVYIIQTCKNTSIKIIQDEMIAEGSRQINEKLSSKDFNIGMDFSKLQIFGA
jgi:hypothetical protein